MAEARWMKPAIKYLNQYQYLCAPPADINLTYSIRLSEFSTSAHKLNDHCAKLLETAVLS